MKTRFVSLIIFISLFFASNSYSFSLSGSKVDGFWIPDMEASMSYAEMRNNAKLNNPITGQLVQKILGSSVLYIKENEFIFFFIGDTSRGNIDIVRGNKIILPSGSVMEYIRENGREYLVVKKNQITLVFNKKYDL